MFKISEWPEFTIASQDFFRLMQGESDAGTTILVEAVEFYDSTSHVREQGIWHLVLTQHRERSQT